jgi:hypothetical protein
MKINIKYDTFISLPQKTPFSLYWYLILQLKAQNPEYGTECVHRPQAIPGGRKH